MVKVGRIRLAYIFISGLSVVLAYCFYGKVLPDAAPKAFDTFSYIGTVATLIGLLITVSEVWHSVSVSKSIQKQAEELVNRLKRVETASGISDCVSILDDVTRSYSGNSYLNALVYFQYFRKICVKLLPQSDTVTQGSLGRIEQLLSSAVSATARTPVPQKIKNDVTDMLMALKTSIENLNPAKGTAHDSH